MVLARRACPMLSPRFHRAKSPSRKLIIKRSGTNIRACARRSFRASTFPRESFLAAKVMDIRSFRALTKFEGSAFAFVAPASSRPGWDIPRLVR